MRPAPHPPAHSANPSLSRRERVNPPAEGQPHRICMGKIAGIHGVKGLVRIIPFGEHIDLIQSCRVFTGENSSQTLNITLRNPQGKYILAGIEGIENRDAAMTLKGTELWIDRSALPEPEEDEFYFEDLKGQEVRNEDGSPAGKVIAVQDFGAIPLLEIRPVSGSSYYLPFTKENVPEVNLGQGYLSVSLPEGLLG